MNNNDNELVRWAKEKIRRDQKFKPACNTFIIGDGIGATGPTGPQGPATITVGTTTTGVPGTDATVTNVGTDENVILEFSIPAGIDGATGPTGPTGATGATPTLTIGTVTTGDPGTEASATLTGTAPDFVLNLTIPQGPTGPAA